MHLRQPLQLPKGRELRVLVHARFSTEEQRQSSIDDQIAACQAFRALPPADGETGPCSPVVQQALAEGGRTQGRRQTPPGVIARPALSCSSRQGRCLRVPPLLAFKRHGSHGAVYPARPYT